jgi:hypothetical protein
MREKPNLPKSLKLQNAVKARSGGAKSIQDVA